MRELKETSFPFSSWTFRDAAFERRAESGRAVLVEAMGATGRYEACERLRSRDGLEW